MEPTTKNKKIKHIEEISAKRTKKKRKTKIRNLFYKFKNKVYPIKQKQLGPETKNI